MSGPAQRGLHDDEGKRVGFWETLMSREVEGPPGERGESPLGGGPIYGLGGQLQGHLVVCHLDRK